MRMLALTFSGSLTRRDYFRFLTVLAVLENKFLFCPGYFNVDINKITDVVCEMASDLRVYVFSAAPDLFVSESAGPTKQMNKRCSLV